VRRDAFPALLIRFSTGTTPETRDRLVALLTDHDLLGIQEDDIRDPRAWTAHFTSAASRDAAAADLKARRDIASLHFEAVQIEDEDWARRTQRDLPAIRVGRTIIAPPWDIPAGKDATSSPTADEIVVVIEPSRGFGTGHHQSTRLCLVLLQNRPIANCTVIDVGTGSGVLAIAAARLGAASVSAIDVDPDAVENARENIARNRVEATVEAHVRDVSTDTLPPADLVFANLTGTLLAGYAPRLAQLVRRSGTLIAAGFTVDEKEMVRGAFEPASLHVAESAEEDDWWAYALVRV